MGFSERPSLLGAVMVCALAEGFERLELKHDDELGAWRVGMFLPSRNGMSAGVVVFLGDRVLEGPGASAVVAAACRALASMSSALRVAMASAMDVVISVDLAVAGARDDTAVGVMQREGDVLRLIDLTSYGTQRREATVARGIVDATHCPCRVCTLEADLAFVAELADDPPIGAAISELLDRNDVSISDVAAAARAAADCDRPLESLDSLALLLIVLSAPSTHAAARVMLRAGFGLAEVADMFRVAGRLAKRALPPSRRDGIRAPIEKADFGIPLQDDVFRFRTASLVNPVLWLGAFGG